jgi:hypothetical protein
VLFFVDKDYSDILKIKYVSDENIFVTKYYSVENYLVNEEVLRRVIVELIHTDDEKFIQSTLNKFKAEHQMFCQQMMIVTSWIIYHRLIKSNVQLSKVKLSDLFRFGPNLELRREFNAKVKTRLLGYLNNSTKVNHSDSVWKDVLSIYRDISKIQDHKVHLRGKFEVWFMAAFVNQLVLNVNSQKKKGEPKIKMKVNLQTANMVEILGCRLQIPDDLESFIAHNLSKV